MDGRIPFDDIFGKIRLLDNGNTCDETPVNIPGTKFRIRSKCNAFVPGLSGDLVAAIKAVARRDIGEGNIFKQETSVDRGRERETKMTTVQRSLEIPAGGQNNRSLGSARYNLSCKDQTSKGVCNAA
ncbi:hypothetical protein PspLS_09311 [Pyricularia sp. CBS 133598]|nr:hypothetical protein PspLS_09311 [Pyricularia sp. CBS 133598]